MAREFVAAHCNHLDQQLIDDAQLLVSEVVSNAVLHGRPSIVLRVRASPPGIGIAVADHGTGLPVDPTQAAAAPDPTAVNGRGMMIVAAVASAWGVVPTQPPPGKTVWFELLAHDGPA